ncbi:MAG: glycerol kinase 5 [Promethearchaeota archaeon]
MGKYVLTLDIGTTNIKAILFDKNGDIFAEARRRPNYIMNEPGQVEQDPKEIWELSKQVIEEVINKNNLKASDIDSMAISTQRASFIFWNKKTGELYSNVITWQDARSANYCEKYNKKFFFRFLRTFAKIMCIFGSAKMRLASMLKFSTEHGSIRTSYFLSTHPEVNEKIKSTDTDVIWGQIETWILWNLTEGKVHATDISNISASAMYDPFTLKWNKPILKQLGIPLHILPEIKESKDDFGVTRLFGGGEIPIRAVVADQQASLFGQCCFNAGEVKVTNGTGSFVDINTGDIPYVSKRRLYPLIAWKIDGEITYMLEGFSHNTGNIIDWIQEELNLIKTPEETEKLAMSVDSTNGVFFLPTFSSGISFPYWDPTTKGNIFGITLSTKKAHIIRAVLEGICFRIRDLIEGIMEDTGIKINVIRADGGVSRNNFLLQFLSDITGLKVERAANPETTALGAAFMAGLATGFWNSKDELLKIRKIDKVFEPKMSEEEREKRYDFWKDIIKRSLNYQIE